MLETLVGFPDNFQNWLVKSFFNSYQGKLLWAVFDLAFKDW
jgi:hypothetical protein